jgi:hypothetical protein
MAGNSARRAGKLWVVLACAWLAGCVTGPEVRVERNPELTLLDPQTFGWVDPLGTDRAAYETLVTTRLKRAVGAALERKGLRYDAEAPDLLVNFYVNLEARQDVRRIPTAHGPLVTDPWRASYFGYRYGLYDAWPAYEVSVVEYEQGTLTIDVLDAASERLAWVGVLGGRVRGRTLAQEQEALRSALDELFSRFP